MYGPVIEGSTFRLRPPRTEDAEAMVGWFEDMEVTARLSTRLPPSLEQERDWLREIATAPNRIFWVIEQDGRAIGTTALMDIDWQRQRAITGTLIGDKAAWGKGIASELMRLRADYAFTELPLRKLVSSYLEGNEASRRAQASAGYREIGRRRQEHFRDGRWIDEILTELYREDWERNRSSRDVEGPV
jgi:RimJ/RimL family protein N-acetyltransferase